MIFTTLAFVISLVGIPFDANSSFLRGASSAPASIRQVGQSGSSNTFAEDGSDITEGLTYHDAGDLPTDSLEGADAHDLICRRIQALLADGSRVISLGGDHSVTYPILQAYAMFYQPLHVLHIDAHADLYNDFSGNPYSHASPFARILEKKLITSLVQAGIRTLNLHQREQAARFGVQMIEAGDFNDHFISSLQGPLYISLDLDALDPAFAPGVSHHEPGGLSTRDVLRMIQKVKVPVVGADIVEYNPVRDINNMTAMVAYKMFKELVSVMLR